ncbi:MAG: alpha/beta fold hydrolase [Deltaproteobacteria bacterium]|nr:alpha/beta fold hydrolase [Deltaproteobacteria bacterium]
MNITNFRKKIIPVSFLSNGFHLKGSIHLPKAARPPVIIGSHGLFSTGNSPKQIALAQKCTDLGIAYFRFDHSGCGESGGEFREVTSLEGRVSDLLNAVHAVEKYPITGDSIGVFGSSMGGAAALSLAQKTEIKAIVTVAAPLRSAPILTAAESSGDLRGLPLSFYKNQLSFDISENLSGISRILIFHGDSDEVVPVSDARELYSKVSSPKKLVIQENGDHPMSDLHHQVQFMRSSVDWFDRWLNHPDL